MTVLQTDRLNLCLLTTQDAPFILELLNSPGWLEYIGDRGVRTLDDAEQYILKGPVASYAELGFGLYLVRLREDDVPIGLCGFLKRGTLACIDIGFAFMPAFTRQGYAFEAASAVMKHARTTLGIDRIMAITLPGNRNSIQLLKRLGMQFDRFITLGDGPELMLFVTDQ
ncbi:GNAT family N-acetyltransferase [Spirosoma rigui]|uniref:GNAT family N-acetyltransferase n=1 Tax=Spirosoma rigui TaxID=564064 RepID=UPI0009B15489|nr:GNAT family N-acetyltransferase [Spirosoma rigui]